MFVLVTFLFLLISHSDCLKVLCLAKWKLTTSLLCRSVQLLAQTHMEKWKNSVLIMQANRGMFNGYAFEVFTKMIGY